MQNFKMNTYEKLLEHTGGATRENLFGVLGKVQDTFGYVPREVVRDLATRTGVSEARIYGALTSYRDFKIGSEGGR
ncbi:MAG: NAD(P)H-dependent oxidoreductase subunit E [Planctomycetes bacterium]|nr:NAD(P)H-dependent oxidoreductase subunit E [Planctomycetota bacterium]